MESRYQLMAFILLTHSLTTAMWPVGAWMGLSRRAARHWMASGLANGTALLMMVGSLPANSATQTALACSFAVFGVVALRRGLHAFLRLPTGNLDSYIALAVIAFNLLVCLPAGWHMPGVMVTAVAACVVLIDSARNVVPPLRREFNVGTSRAALFVHGLALTVFVLIAIHAALGRDADWLLPDTREEREFGLVFVSVAVSILTSFVLGYLVIMRLVNRLEHLSQHDALTGLLNRRAIETVLDRELLRLQRFGDPFTIVLIDIDHFKRINDRYGHAAGDQVLSTVARLLLNHAREVDRIARFGGEEFCAVLPRTQGEGAFQAAERLRLAVLKAPIVWDGETIPVTISAGVASARDASDSLQSLLRRADEGLYEAKAAGRNRVVARP